MKFSSLDFFAGSGLVTIGLEPYFDTVWANDFSPKKEAVFRANFPEKNFSSKPIEEVDGADVPAATLAWASFPCQDLSLAGNLGGISKTSRSGLFWEWLRVLDEMGVAGKRPPLVAAENVVGLVVANRGEQFRIVYKALRERRYRVGAFVVDARLFLPQSRPRAFFVAVSEEIKGYEHLTSPAPLSQCHTQGLRRSVASLKDAGHVWWALPEPSLRVKQLSQILEPHAEFDDAEKTRHLMQLMSPSTVAKLSELKKAGGRWVGSGYRRTRPGEGGKSEQRLELRFDGVAGCLRTPRGGSSRQIVVIVDNGRVRTRLLTVRECARLMGAPSTFALPESYNDAYGAMGDGVAVPVTNWVARHLLAPLAKQSHNGRKPSHTAA